MQNAGAGLAARPEVLATVLLLSTVAIWGSTPQVTAVGADYSQPLTLTSLRAAPTALVLLLVLPLLRFKLPRGRTAWLFTSVSGILMVTVFLGGFTEAVSRSGPGNAIVLASTSPFWIAILSRVVHGEHISLKTATGLIIGFGGVILVFSSQLGAHGDTGQMVTGLALALAAALGWAIGTLIVKEMLTREPGTDVLGLITGQYLVGGAVLLAISFSAEGSGGAQWGSVNLWLAVAFISIVGCAIATIAYLTALRWVSATRASAWAFLSPAVAVLIAVGLGDVPSAAVFAGMAITIVGVGIINAPSRSPREVTIEPLVAPVGETAAP